MKISDYPEPARDVISHLCSRRFSQRIICSRTNRPVTFADCGDEHSSETALYCLPSGCSRWVAVGLDAVARKEGVRLIAIDRPGSGGTPICPLSERLKTSNEQVLSVLDHLEITSPISLLSHSGGFYYALDLLKTNLDLFHPNPRLVASSPWVPCSCSNSKLSLIPTFLVRGAVKGVSTLGPSISRLFDGLGGWSSGVSSSIGLSSPTLSSQAKADQDSRTKSKSQKKYPKAYFHPPYTPPSKSHPAYLSLDSFQEAAKHPSTGRVIVHERSGGVKLIGEFIAVEGTEGIGEDLLFCLGRAEGGDKRLIEILNDTLTEFERNQKRFDATIVWANEDGLIPLKGRNWLSKIITDSPAVDETILEMAPPAAHDDPFMSEEVLTTLMRCLKGEKLD